MVAICAMRRRARRRRPSELGGLFRKANITVVGICNISKVLHLPRMNLHIPNTKLRNSPKTRASCMRFLCIRVNSEPMLKRKGAMLTRRSRCWHCHEASHSPKTLQPEVRGKRRTAGGERRNRRGCPAGWLSVLEMIAKPRLLLHPASRSSAPRAREHVRHLLGSKNRVRRRRQDDLQSSSSSNGSMSR